MLNIYLVQHSQFLTNKRPEDYLSKVALGGDTASCDISIIGYSHAVDHILMFLLPNHLSRVTPNHQFSLIVSHNQVLPDKINTSIDNLLLVLIVHDIDQLPTHHPPLLNILHPTAEERIMTVWSKAQSFDLPRLLIGIRHHP